MLKLQRVLCQQRQFKSDHVLLTREQTHYLAKVLRLGDTDKVIVMDGLGHWWTGTLSKGCTQARDLERVDINHELPIQINLVSSPPKGKGFEDVIQISTELGVRHIYPLISSRTQVFPSDKKLIRWQKIAAEAAEQSLRQFVPEIHPPLDLEAIEKRFQAEFEHVFFCSTQPHRPLLPHVLNKISPAQAITVITGPEGGWSPAEETQFERLKWQGVSLGKRILRAVTAPICAMSLISMVYEDDEGRHSRELS